MYSDTNNENEYHVGASSDVGFMNVGERPSIEKLAILAKSQMLTIFEYIDVTNFQIDTFEAISRINSF